jgi:hypothetical protein
MKIAYEGMEVATLKYDNSIRKQTDSHRKYDKVATERMNIFHFQFSAVPFPVSTGHTGDLTSSTSLPPPCRIKKSTQCTPKLTESAK